MENVDDIIYAVAVLIGVVTLAGFLLKMGRLPFIKAKVAGQEIEIGKQDDAPKPAVSPHAIHPPAGPFAAGQTQDRRKSCLRHTEIDEAVDGLIDQKHQAERRIMAAQIRSIRDSSESFDDIFPGSDPLSIEALWARFDRALFMASVENHILSHVTTERDGSLRLEQDYLDDKLMLIREGHRRLAVMAKLPEWDAIEMRMSLLLRVALDRFVTISKSEWDNYTRSVESAYRLAGDEHPAIAKRLKRLLSDE